MNKADLEGDIRYELGQLRVLAGRAAELSTLPASQRELWECMAVAKLVADFYMGCENLIKRHHRALGRAAVEAPDSHTQLLRDFLDDSGLGAHLSCECRERMELYLRFRHRFVHGYGSEVKWEMVEEPLRLIPEMVELVAHVWEQWLSGLPADGA